MIIQTLTDRSSVSFLPEATGHTTIPVAEFLQGPEPARGRTRQEYDLQGIQIPGLDLVPWNTIHDQRSIRGNGEKGGVSESVEVGEVG